MLLIEYIKRMLGEQTGEAPSLSAEELTLLLREHLLTGPSGERLELWPWGNSRTVYRASAGCGCWLDGEVQVFVNAIPVAPEAYELDHYLGEVRFKSPLAPGSRVSVHTWRVNFNEVLSRALLWLATDYARNSVKTELAGISFDFTGVAKELRQQAMQVQTQSGPVKLTGNDFPH